MNITVCNIPLRPDNLKTTYPPLGAMAVIQSLESAGRKAQFYDIDFYRPSDATIKDYFAKDRFDIIGISARVATSYRGLKHLVSLIRSASEKSIIIVGGPITASSEVILKFNEVDYCVIGEGEKIIGNLVNYIEKFGKHKNEKLLKDIRGVCFLNERRDFIFTGYEKLLLAEEIRDPDYGILKKYSDIKYYLPSPFIYEQFKYDKRAFEPHRVNGRLATIPSSRGCINRCTFCYRSLRGIRIFKVDTVINNIKHLMNSYNVKFVSFGDESFGASKEWMEEFVEKIAPLDILYRVSGICCENITPEILKKMRESGCVAVHYGFESGSNRILKVMGKKADREMNERVAAWTHEAGIQTVPAILVGMPGETFNTIKETTEFVKKITEYWLNDPIISVNALVVLPGTPVYEYARYRGLLGNKLENEEYYLEMISGEGGTSLKHINLTDYPYLLVLSWIRYICWTARFHYYNKRCPASYSFLRLCFKGLRIMLRREKADEVFRKNLYANPVFYHLRYILSVLVVTYKTYKDDKRIFFRRLIELLAYPLKKILMNKKFNDYISIRTLVRQEIASSRQGAQNSFYWKRERV